MNYAAWNWRALRCAGVDGFRNRNIFSAYSATPREFMISPPRMKSGDDLFQIRIRKLATHTVDESAHVPRINEQRLLATITALAIVFLFG